MLTIRPAAKRDLPAVYEVWYETEVAGIDEPPEPGENPWFDFLLESGVLVVADSAGRVVGFAGVRREGTLSVLTDCFVRPAHQSSGVARALLDAVLPVEGARATFASTDPRAVASYARRGLRPRWPAYYGSLPAAAAPTSPRSLPPASAGTDARLMLGELASDPAYADRFGARCLEVRDGERLLGAALVTLDSPYRVFDRDLATVLQSAASPGGTVLVLSNVIAWAIEMGAPGVELQVPGSHEAFPWLLEAGFRISGVDTACSSDEALLADPATTTFYGEMLPATADAPQFAQADTAGPTGGAGPEL